MSCHRYSFLIVVLATLTPCNGMYAGSDAYKWSHYIKSDDLFLLASSSASSWIIDDNDNMMYMTVAVRGLVSASSSSLSSIEIEGTVDGQLYDLNDIHHGTYVNGILEVKVPSTTSPTNIKFDDLVASLKISTQSASETLTFEPIPNNAQIVGFNERKAKSSGVGLGFVWTKTNSSVEWNIFVTGLSQGIESAKFTFDDDGLLQHDIDIDSYPNLEGSWILSDDDKSLLKTEDMMYIEIGSVGYSSSSFEIRTSVDILSLLESYSEDDSSSSTTSSVTTDESSNNQPDGSGGSKAMIELEDDKVKITADNLWIISSDDGKRLSVGGLKDEIAQVEQDIIASVPPAVSEMFSRRGLGSTHYCDSGPDSRIVGIKSDGSVECDDITPDSSVVQRRVTGQCGVNEAIRVIHEDGSVDCEDSAFTPDMNIFQKRINFQCGEDEIVQGVNMDGSVECVVPPSLLNFKSRIESLEDSNGDVAKLEKRVDDFVQVGDWTSWTECSKGCGGGIQFRYRSLTIDGEDANELVESRSCNTAACNACPSGSHRFYFLNSGSAPYYISSYAKNNQVYLNGVKLIATLSFGQTYKLTSSEYSPKNGDYFCASSGGINIVSSNQRQFPPSIMAGRSFVVPVVRDNNQVLYILALESATINMYFAASTAPTRQRTVTGGQILVERFGLAGNSLRIVSTGKLVITYGGKAPGPTGTNENVQDYIVIPPSASKIYGFTSKVAGVGITGNQGTQIRVLCTDKNTEDRTALNRGQLFGVSRVSNDRYLGHACYYESLTPGIELGGGSFGDGEGYEATAFLPAAYMTKIFILPIDTISFSAVCSGQVSFVLWRLDDSSPNREFTVLEPKDTGIPTNHADLSKHLFSKASFQKAGTIITSSTPCFFVVNDNVVQKEFLVYGDLTQTGL